MVNQRAECKRTIIKRFTYNFFYIVNTKNPSLKLVNYMITVNNDYWPYKIINRTDGYTKGPVAVNSPANVWKNKANLA